MLKYIAFALIGIGIYIGATYKEQIDDVVSSHPLEQVRDMYDDAKEQVSNQADELSKKIEEFSN